MVVTIKVKIALRRRRTTRVRRNPNINLPSSTNFPPYMGPTFTVWDTSLSQVRSAALADLKLVTVVIGLWTMAGL